MADESAAAGTRAAVPTPAAPVPPRRRRLRRILLLLGPLLALIVAGYFYATGGRFVGTDNAYVKAHMVSVSADIAGRVVDVMVHENQEVTAGTPLFKLDEEPLRIALDEADANLAVVKNDIEAEKAAYRQAQEQLQIAESNVAFAQREFERRQKLVDKKIISESEFDEARNSYQVALREAGAVRQDMQRILSELAGDPEIDPATHPRYREAEAKVAQAALDLRRAVVFARDAGIVSMVDQLRPGDYVEAGHAAFSIVGDDALWVEANLKETDLTYVRPGQSATIEVDSFPGKTWTARVDSIGAATGSEFSLLPPQNATGNWVKVVQRVPVRLVIESNGGDAPLRAGMSAVIEIDTGHVRELPGVVRTALAWVQGAPMTAADATTVQ
jgi:membrane fusion protein (multidrug efflux system)